MNRFRAKRSLLSATAPRFVNTNQTIMGDDNEENDDVSDWSLYFQEQKYISVCGFNSDSVDFCTYFARSKEKKNSLRYIFVLLHGAGHTSMSFALLTRALTQSMPECACLTFDLPAHGQTNSEARDESALSLEALLVDTAALLEKLLAPYFHHTSPNSKSNSDTSSHKDVTAPHVVLVGHSLGGALAVRLATRLKICSPAGIVVMDVVEGSALAALEHMDNVLDARPQSFFEPADAVNWAVRAGVLKSKQAARISIPAQLCAVVDDNNVDNNPKNKKRASNSSSSSVSSWRWRTNLAATAPHWRGWFQGLSKDFLSCKAARMLMLADTDRLDVDLTTGHMQGKFQLVLISNAGHSLMEDAPMAVARHIHDFAVRQCTPNDVLRQANAQLRQQAKKK